MSRRKSKSYESFDNLMVKHLRVKDLKSKKSCSKKAVIEELIAANATIQNLVSKIATIEKLVSTKATIKNLTTNNATINNLNGIDLKKPNSTVVIGSLYDCMDCNISDDAPYGNPVKPDFVDQDVWDFLECNRNAYQAQLQAENLEGRNSIRCIKKAYGCAPSCPPDCPIPAGATGCADCPQPPNCTVDPSCIPDPNTCDLEVPLYLFATQTLPPYDPTNNLIFITSQTFNLDINNKSCTISPRVATVLFQYAYKNINGFTGPTGATGSRCLTCPGLTGATGPVCMCGTWLGPEIECGINNITCKQFEATININLGENFVGVIDYPTSFIQKIYDSTKNFVGLMPAAIQMAIFIEDGLEIKKGVSRAGEIPGGPSSTGSSSTFTPPPPPPEPPQPPPPDCPPGITPPGCTVCSVPGTFLCPTEVMDPASDGKYPFSSQISCYRLPEYDPPQPNVNINGVGYYWRMGTDVCYPYPN